MTTGRWLAGIALALGGMAAVAGSPFQDARGRIDIDAITPAGVPAPDHVTAIELAGWIRDRREGLRVVDVRPPAEFAEYQIPTAENITIDALSRAAFAPRETVVLYSADGSGDGAEAAHGAAQLRARGLREVFQLRGGLAGWLDGVMAPEIEADATPEARASFERAAEISRYFGGRPRIGPAGRGSSGPTGAVPLADRIRAEKRRGC